MEVTVKSVVYLVSLFVRCFFYSLILVLLLVTDYLEDKHCNAVTEAYFNAVLGVSCHKPAQCVKMADKPSSNANEYHEFPNTGQDVNLPQLQREQGFSLKGLYTVSDKPLFIAQLVLLIEITIF